MLVCQWHTTQCFAQTDTFYQREEKVIQNSKLSEAQINSMVVMEKNGYIYDVQKGLQPTPSTVNSS